MIFELTFSGDYLHPTMTDHQNTDLHMNHLRGDLACFINSLHGLLREIIVVYVDNTIGIGNKFVEEKKINEKSMTTSSVKTGNEL